MTKRSLSIAALVLATAACTDPVRPDPVSPSLAASVPTRQEVFARYVALGTSNSQGASAAGISAATLRAAWPAQLATRVGVRFSLPLVYDPGCTPPLVPPLVANLALVAAFGAFGAGDD